MKSKMHINLGNWETSINTLASALNVQNAPKDGGTKRKPLHSFPGTKVSVKHFCLDFL